MHMFAKLCGTSVAMCLLLDCCLKQAFAQPPSPGCSCQIEPTAVPCQTQPSCPCQTMPSPPENGLSPPCNNCCKDFCRHVPTLDYCSPSLVNSSPFYQVAISGMEDQNQIDSVCFTYFDSDGMGTYLQFITTVFCNGSYSVSQLLVSDGSESGVFRAQGLLTTSGISSFVSDAYLFGSTSCNNCTQNPLLAYYSCTLFADCSLPALTSDYLYVLASSPDVPPCCSKQGAALFRQAGFPPAPVAYPPHKLNRRCVTSFNGAPCINADLVPCGDGIPFPLPASQCGCVNA